VAHTLATLVGFPQALADKQHRGLLTPDAPAHPSYVHEL
jgi:hypothetical protein